MKLTTLQETILRDIIAGKRYKEIAATRYLSHSHIRKEIVRAAKENGCATVTQLAVRFAMDGRERIR